LKAYSTFISSPYVHRSEHGIAFRTAKQSLSHALMKMGMEESNAKREISYGMLSGNNLSELCKLGSNIAWPLIGLGTVTGIINNVLRGENINDHDNLSSSDDEVINALNALKRPCLELNALCQEGIEHIRSTLQLGAYAKPHPLRQLFTKKPKDTPDQENVSDIGTDAFLPRFDSGLDVFRNQSADNFGHFYNEKHGVLSQSILFVLFLELLLLAIAQEIRSVILFVDNLHAEGAMTRKRFIFPNTNVFHRALGMIFHPQITCQRYREASPQSYTGRVKRIPL
jgi:hypothetical protein